MAKSRCLLRFLVELLAWHLHLQMQLRPVQGTGGSKVRHVVCPDRCGSPQVEGGPKKTSIGLHPNSDGLQPTEVGECSPRDQSNDIAQDVSGPWDANRTSMDTSKDYLGVYFNRETRANGFVVFLSSSRGSFAASP